MFSFIDKTTTLDFNYHTSIEILFIFITLALVYELAKKPLDIFNFIDHPLQIDDILFGFFNTLIFYLFILDNPNEFLQLYDNNLIAVNTIIIIFSVYFYNLIRTNIKKLFYKSESNN